MTLPCSVVCYSPVQVQPVVVMREVSIDYLQQQVRTFWGESQEVCIFLWGRWHLPPRIGPRLGPPLGSLRPCTLPPLPPRAPAPLTRPLPPHWPDGLPCAGCGFCRGGVGLWVFLSFPFPPPPSPPFPWPVAALPSSSSLSPGPSGLDLLRKSRGFATMWAAPWRVKDYLCHNGSGLLLRRPPPP